MPVLLLILSWCMFAASANADDQWLIRVGSPWRFSRGTNEPAQVLGAWRLNEFDDSLWSESMSGFSTAAYAPEPGYLPDYGYLYRTLYLRKTFVVTNPASLAELTLRVDYDDGFIAYLNGQEIARRGVAGSLNQPQPVNTYAIYHPRGPTEEINVSAALPLLHPGSNLLAVQVFGWGTNDYTVAFVPELLGNFTRGPYIQNTTSNSTQIIFKTLSASPAFVELKESAGPVTRIGMPDAGTNHVATLAGLFPDTAYDYRIGADIHGREVLSDWHSFRTFKTRGSITFEVVGDSGWGGVAQHRIAAQMRDLDTDLIMHVGDLVYYAFTHYAEDFRCLSVYADQMAEVPMFIALGNHEKYANITNVLETFYLPTNNVTGTEHFYAFDHGDVHFTIVWSDLEAYSDYSPGSPQYQWLENDLRNTAKPWKFLFFHHVWRSSGPHGADDYDLNGIRDSLQLEQGPVALAKKYGVQVIFNGHDHDYERFAPGGGVLSVVTGGGGAALYAPWQMHGDSVQYYLRNEFLKVSVDSEQALLQAIGLNGEVFDEVHLKRTWPERRKRVSSWHSPQIERTVPTDLDGNVSGQIFDFDGEPVGGKVGLYSSTGRLFVNSDHRNLYIGLDEVMLHAGDELFLFLETPGLRGITNLTSFVWQNGLTNSLQTLATLAFTNFAPAVGLVLGDELGDGGYTNFIRAGSSNNTGQGAFYLTPELPLVPGQKIAQFNRSPEGTAIGYEQNADFIKIALPFSAIGAKPGDQMKIGAIIGLRADRGTNSPVLRQLDAGLGLGVTRADGLVYLEPIEIELGPDQDLDGDGLSFEQELTLGTDPNNPDTDGDGLPDGWEVAHGLDPLRPDSLEDADGDGMTNLSEFIAGTDPRDSTSRLAISAQNVGAGQIELRWSATPEKIYQVQVRDDWSEAYRDLADPKLPRRAAQRTEAYRLPLSSGIQAQFYRIRLLPE